jgi:hypothetical protein
MLDREAQGRHDVGERGVRDPVRADFEQQSEVPMKAINFFVLTLAVLCVFAVPVSAPTAQAATIVQGPDGDGAYVPCNCTCVTILGKKFCWCVCSPQ